MNNACRLPSVPLFVNTGVLILNVPYSGKQWYDGASYITQCPIMSGQSFTYRFKVTEFPGTYFWHAHTGAQRIDGLSGPLIVRPRRRLLPARPRYDKEYIMFIQDWYHTPGGVSSRGLNQPFDAAFVTNTSGQFTWVGNPQSVLINGQGNYEYCTIPTSGTNTTCSISNVNASSPNGCSLDTFEVISGRTYLFRIINAASLTYQTVCFDQHNITIVAADARPVKPYTTTCVDVNAGQRSDNPGFCFWGCNNKISLTILSFHEQMQVRCAFNSK